MLDRGLKPLWASDRRAAARRHGVQLLLVLDYVCELPGLRVVRVLHRWLREREPQDGRRLRARGAGWLNHGGDSMSITDTEWTRQEAGWYTHPTLGGICREQDGWGGDLRASDW